MKATYSGQQFLLSPTTDELLHSLRLTFNLTRVAAGRVGFACSGQ